MSSVPALTKDFNADTSMQGFTAGKKIIVAVHLKKDDYDRYSSLNLQFKVRKRQVASAERVDLTGNATPLTVTGNATTSVSVSTKDVPRSNARVWNEEGHLPRTFYVVLTCRQIPAHSK
jgi:hypothetical protein